ncbi:HlyD family secretion protein [Algoriphagus terrigena]|uniref:HlyD family secretion protein n=1 Tax=Algoriphagus terrigena TaxID=344884 RepID=UPI000408E85F|nr:HlyD family secretion protein [Algoriphagus terrigena]
MKPAVRNILILTLITATLAVIYWLVISFYNEKNRTDDAHVDGNIVPAIARTDGFVDSIFVEDDQYVSEGDLLVQLDTIDLYLQLEQALTALSISNTNVKRAETGIEVMEMEKKIAAQNIEAQSVSVSTSESNYKRNKVLQEKGVVSVQVYEKTEESLKSNEVALQNAYNRQVQVTAQLEDAKTQLQLAHQNITAQMNQIAIIKQNIQYASIKAPVSGFVSKRKIQAGQMVRTGTQIYSIVQSDELWATANFKETQLAAFPVGKRVEIIADAYPDEVFYGIVESIGSATGSKFALLPPDNATGNYVKVIQRVPVRIRFEDTELAQKMLRPGFSLVVSQ